MKSRFNLPDDAEALRITINTLNEWQGGGELADDMALEDVLWRLKIQLAEELTSRDDESQ